MHTQAWQPVFDPYNTRAGRRKEKVPEFSAHLHVNPPTHILFSVYACVRLRIDPIMGEARQAPVILSDLLSRGCYKGMDGHSQLFMWVLGI